MPLSELYEPDDINGSTKRNTVSIVSIGVSHRQHSSNTMSCNTTESMGTTRHLSAQHHLAKGTLGTRTPSYTDRLTHDTPCIAARLGHCFLKRWSKSVPEVVRIYHCIVRIPISSVFLWSRFVRSSIAVDGIGCPMLDRDDGFKKTTVFTLLSPLRPR